jgi:hypothetical protein
MRSNHMFSLAAAMVLAAGELRAQTPEDVDMAIKLGQSGKASQLLSECRAASSGPGLLDFRTGPSPHGSYQVSLGTTLGRVAFMAAEAKKKYMPYTRADVPEDLLKPAVHVWIEPNEPIKFQKNVFWASPIKHVVLKAKEKEDAVVQPEKLEMVPVEWTIVVGKFTGNRANVIFPIDAVKALPAGDVDIVLITEAGERRCKLGQGDRKKLGLGG